MDLWVGGELVTVAAPPSPDCAPAATNCGIGIKISNVNHLITFSGQDQYKAGAKGAEFFTGTVRGHSVTGFEFQLKDSDRTMFSDTSLPVDLSFTGAVDAVTGVTAKLDLASTGITLSMTSGYLGETVATPEPATLLLLASGLAGMAGAAWRRHRRNQSPTSSLR